MKKSKVLVALVLALALSLGGIVAALAADLPKSTGTADSPAEAAITKHLQLPKGTIVPTINFTFSVTAVSVDEVPAATAGNMPVIGTITIPFNAGKTGDTDTDNITHIYVQSEDIFADAAGKWPHAGVYEYDVKETNSDINTTHETMNCSAAEYRLRVYVLEAKDAAGNGTGKYYAATITAERTQTDAGDPVPPGNKVDPTPDGPDGDGYSGMIFTNTYVKTNGTDTPDNPDPTKPAQATLSVSKAVKGEFGSTSVYFSFALTVYNPAFTDAPALDPALPGSYKAYVVDASGIATSTENGADAGKNYIEFADGAQNTFKLKDGQRLVFVNTPVGTRYDVAEDGTPAYQASLLITCNNVAEDDAIDGSTLGAGVEAEDRFVGEAANKADFTNTRDDVTPTGLNLNDLPFIGMIILALGAAAAFIAFKARKRKSYN